MRPHKQTRSDTISCSTHSCGFPILSYKNVIPFSAPQTSPWVWCITTSLIPIVKWQDNQDNLKCSACRPCRTLHHLQTAAALWFFPLIIFICLPHLPSCNARRSQRYARRSHRRARDAAVLSRGSYCDSNRRLIDELAGTNEKTLLVIASLCPL